MPNFPYQTDLDGTQWYRRRGRRRAMVLDGPLGRALRAHSDQGVGRAAGAAEPPSTGEVTEDAGPAGRASGRARVGREDLGYRPE